MNPADGDLYAGFPEGFFRRSDESNDAVFYEPPRLVTHIDDAAIAQVGRLYAELELVDADVLDLCSSWISHFPAKPRRLVALGMNADELARNDQASSWVVQDLNVNPTLPFDDDTFDAVTCCVSVDYLVRPIEVFMEAARIVRPGGVAVCTFSNRCFPSKAIHGWLQAGDRARCALVAEYLRRAGWAEPTIEWRNEGAIGVDPLFAVRARIER